MDAVRGNCGVTARQTSPHREALRADLVVKVRQAAPAGALTETERQQALGFYNSALVDLDRIRDPKYAQDLEICFPTPKEERDLHAALLVKRSDNDEAREVKGEYRQLLNDIKKDAALARKLASKLGPGTHSLSNGDVVHISCDKSGNVTVRTESSDGSSKVVSYNTRTPGDARVRTTSADGQTTVIQRRGQTVTREDDRVETTYSLDGQGRPVREARGPGRDDYIRTTVNKDGSTDTRALLYYADEVEEGQDPAVYEDTHQPPRGQKYQDAGAGRAIEKLKARNPRTITRDMMRELVVSATADFDGQAAGKEYQDLKAFVTQNWGKLDEEAKQAWQVYERYVYDAQANGQTGIYAQDLEDMEKEMAEIGGGGHRPRKYRDAGAGQAIEDFRKNEPEKITPEALQKLIVAATADLDGQAAGNEYQDLKDYIAQVQDKLTPEARRVWQTYQNYVLAAQAKGQTGIEQSEYDRMLKEMEQRPTYQDESAREAIEDLEKQNPSRIDDRQVVDLILRATADPDNQSAGAEYQDLEKFVTANWDRLSPEARQKWQVYERFVQQARAQGQTGMTPAQYLQMMGQLFG